MLSLEKEKEVRKNLRDYSKTYEEEDMKLKVPSGSSIHQLISTTLHRKLRHAALCLCAR